MTTARPASLYLVGSCAAGTDGPRSDVDLVFITETGKIADDDAKRLAWLGGVHLLRRGRPVETLTIQAEAVRSELLLASCLLNGRLLIGPQVAIPIPRPLAWAVQAERYGFLLARRDHPEYHRAAVLWVAAGRLVTAGAPVPVLKGMVAAMWAERVGGRWVGLVARAGAREDLRPSECREFLAVARAADI